MAPLTIGVLTLFLMSVIAECAVFGGGCRLVENNGKFSFLCKKKVALPSDNNLPKKQAVSTNVVAREPPSTNVINLKSDSKKKRRRHRLKLRCRMIEGAWHNMHNTTEILTQLPSLLSISCPRAMVLHSTKMVTNTDEKLMRLDYKCCSVHNIPANTTKSKRT